MDLMQFLQKSALSRCKQARLLVLPLFLLGCAATTQHTVRQEDKSAQSQQVPTVGGEQAEIVDKPTLPVSPDVLYYILTAEIAGQRGEVGAAVDLYYRASEVVDSPALANRSAQVATITRDQQRINRALERWVEVEPQNPDVYIMRAPFLMLNQDYDGVVNVLNKGLALAETADQRRNYMLRISENLAEVATPEQAMRTIEQLDFYQANDPAVHFAYARLAYFYKQNEIALTELKPLLRDEPGNEDYLILKADVLQRMGQPEQGLKLISKLAQQEGASEQLRFTYGKLLGDSRQNEKAREVFEEMLLQNPENRDVQFALGLLALEEQDGQQAKSYFADLLKRGDPSYQVAYFMGLAEELNNNPDAALVWFAAVPVHSTYFEMAQNSYMNLLLSRGEIAKVRMHLAGLRKDLPAYAQQYYLIESSILRDQGNHQAAFEVLTEALQEYPTSFDVLYSRAMVAEALDKLDVLEQDLRAILKQNPDNSQALNALGYTLTDRTDRHQEALQLINRALELEPDEPYYLDSLGWVYYRLGDLENAEKYLREAVEIQPHVEFIAHLGEVLWVRGKHSEARQVWDDGLEQDADNKILRETMRRFSQ